MCMCGVMCLVIRYGVFELVCWMINMFVCIVDRLLIVLSSDLFLLVDDVLMFRLIMFVDSCLVVILNVVCVCVEFLKNRLNIFLLCSSGIFFILWFEFDMEMNCCVVFSMCVRMLCDSFLIDSKCLSLLFFVSCGLVKVLGMRNEG